MKADLHLHTTASDGKLSPEETVRLASHRSLDVIAITDHDSVEGVAPALEEAKAFSQLLVIPGVEISTRAVYSEVHVLGYYVDFSDREFNRILAELRDSRLERGRQMVAKLSDIGVHIEWDRVLSLASEGAVGRPHIAQAMLERGYISSLRDAFASYIGRDGPAHVERKKCTPFEATETIRRAGGIPVLAHPADIEDLDHFVADLKAAGILGIEVYYSSYSRSTIARLENLADRYGLAATGGSDYHGLDESIGAELGSVHVPRKAVERLISLGTAKGG